MIGKRRELGQSTQSTKTKTTRRSHRPELDAAFHGSRTRQPSLHRASPSPPMPSGRPSVSQMNPRAHPSGIHVTLACHARLVRASRGITLVHEALRPSRLRRQPCNWLYTFSKDESLSKHTTVLELPTKHGAYRDTCTSPFFACLCKPTTSLLVEDDQAIGGPSSNDPSVTRHLSQSWTTSLPALETTHSHTRSSSARVMSAARPLYQLLHRLLKGGGGTPTRNKP